MVLVIFVFLRTLAATIIPSIAVPLSLVGTFGVMYLLGYSLDNLSLMALTISTGFVVDDAIVMIENIERYIEEGHSPLEAALQGAGQIGFTIVSLTVSLIAVLIPLLFMGDIVGRLFREFAVTLSVTILFSAIISLTLTPMMCSLLLRPKDQAKHGRFYQWSERAFANTIAFYGRTRQVRPEASNGDATGYHRHAGAHHLYVHRGAQGLLPGAGHRRHHGHHRRAGEHIVHRDVENGSANWPQAILKDKDVVSLSSFIGVDGTNTTPNSGRIQINLKSRDDRNDDVTTIMKRIQQEVAGVEGITLYMQAVQDLTVEDRVSRTQYQFSLEDADPKELATWTDKMVAKLKTLPQLRDVATDQQNQAAQANLVIDRDTASRLGVTTSAIDNTLYDAFGQRLVSIMFTQLNQYHVVLEVDPSFRDDPDSLKSIYVPAGGGQSPASPGGNAPAANTPSVGVLGANASQVPLSAIAHFETTTGPLTINHQGQFPAVTISFNLGNGASLGDAVKAIQQTADDLGLPPSIQLAFQGTARAFEASLANEGWLILAAIVTVYIVLGVLYESYIHPITILSTLPSAGVGAILALITISHGPGSDGLDRHHPADRHREEERHHDD